MFDDQQPADDALSVDDAFFAGDSLFADTPPATLEDDKPGASSTDALYRLASYVFLGLTALTCLFSLIIMVG